MNQYRERPLVVVASTVAKAATLGEAIGVTYGPGIIPTSPRSVLAGAGRGIVSARGVLVDAECWPLNDRVHAFLDVLLITTGGKFYRIEAE